MVHNFSRRGSDGHRLCYLVTTSDAKILVDCGLFQDRTGRRSKPSAFPFDPTEIDLLSDYAHIDHSGMIPRCKSGFQNSTIATHATQIFVLLCWRTRAISESEAE